MTIKEIYDIFLSSGGIQTDSRKVTPGQLFFALKGENFDGNEFAQKALDAGACYAVVSWTSPAVRERNPRFIKVGDTLKTLQDLACFHAIETKVGGVPIPILALTGTNGKTTTKELIRAVLSTKYSLTATEGNLNNDIGVPLSILKINSASELAVIEMGASHPDDIEHLTRCARPCCGLITNVGRAHLQGFGSFEGVKRAKGQLYDYLCGHGGVAFVNVDDPTLAQMAKARGEMKVIPYGQKLWNTMVLPSDAEHPFLCIAIPSDVPESAESECLNCIETHLVGSYNADNVLAALAVGFHFGVSFDEAARAISQYVPSNNRSQMTRTQSNTLIVDAYNANPSSMSAALDNFDSVSAPRKAVLLGSMGELGEDSLAEHCKILHRLQGSHYDKVFLVGEEFRRAMSNEGLDFQWFATSEELFDYLKTAPLTGYYALVKGSRSMMMEKVLPAL